ncbi:ATP-dependent zinc metalloprotease FtsH [bacterium]|jgi:cell division protease FtsH|nr:ATP-dependent zinc metalloprotease FtsH [Gemmataceae bacterium]NBS88802.1 ATP-dependent zinc metalloprotease FtsH [bacterium]NBT60571.1 ATP-dependent zinc metalloprotease FtsH [Planctomycetia bacterium]
MTNPTQDGSQPQGSGKPPKKRSFSNISGNLGWLVILFLLLVLLFSSSVGNNNTVLYSDFVKLMLDEEDSKKIRKITFIGVDRISVDVNDHESIKDERLKEKAGTRGKFTVNRAKLDDPGLVAQMDKLIRNGMLVDQQEDNFAGLSWFIMMILPAIILIVFFLFILPKFRDPMGGGFLSNYIKSPAKKYEKTKMKVTFEDVAGLQHAKGELQEIVEFLKSPDKFTRLGASIPKGVLLVGPPGTGKTLLARAVAGEAGVPYYSISGSEFIQMFVGVGASRVRDMFKTAKDNSPCILFIDEIDAVGRMRGAGVGGGSDEREQTLNQILSEMDGFQPTETVIVLAATNRPDVLDSALLRPGRFDRHITIDRPTWQGRLAILKVHTRNKPLADNINLEMVARKMIGMTGADLRNLANEAALVATRLEKDKIDRADFEVAADRVLIGPKREEVLTPEDKRRTAYHEVGHALVTWLMPGADRPQKVSIIPRGQSLGVNLNAPDEDRFHHGLDHFKNQLVMIMGGRAADKLIYNQPYAGAESDLKRATRLARMMVTHWGMSEKLGPMTFKVGEEHVFLGKEMQEARDFSEQTAALIDSEVQNFLRQADDNAFQLLSDNRIYVEKLVDELMTREELLRDEIEDILTQAGFIVTPAKSSTTISDS